MGIKLSDFIKDPHNVFTQEEAEMIYLIADYTDGVCTSNDKYYSQTISFDKKKKPQLKHWRNRNE